MNQIPSNYLLEKFYTYAGSPAFNKYTKTYNGSCPVCREGKSWLKKKRLFYYPDTNSFYCFNCTKSWNAYTWLYQVTGMTKEEIYSEIKNGDISRDISNDINKVIIKRKPQLILPHDSINIMDDQQRKFYENDNYFQLAVDYINQRKLDKAINKSPTYYISLTDMIHKNRLCIPYYDYDNKIVFYQTRSLDGSEPRYLNKIGCDKTVFGIERVDPDLEFVFIFEGALDAMMVKNGIAVAGLTLTDSQEKQLAKFPFHKRIWVTDNPRKDQAAKENLIKLVKDHQTAFKWLDKPYKDFNEWAVKENLNEIDYNIIINSTY